MELDDLRSEFSTFIKLIHGKPEDMGFNPKERGSASAPFFVPSGSCESVALEKDFINEGAVGSSILQSLGSLFWHTLGHSHIKIFPKLTNKNHFKNGAIKKSDLSTRRPLPSGGARYPVDLTLVVPEDAHGSLGNLGGKVLNYAPQYHRLFIAKDNDVHKAMSESLRQSDASISIIMTINFMRTYCKYGDFTYRLSSVDAGFVLGRLVRIASEFANVTVDFDLANDSLDKSLGLNTDLQASYCVIKLTPKQKDCMSTSELLSLSIPSNNILEENSILAKPSRRFLDSHRFAHRTQVANQTDLNKDVQTVNANLFQQYKLSSQVISLEDVAPLQHNLKKAIKYRQSKAHAFNGQPISQSVLVTCLKNTVEGMNKFIATCSRTITKPDLLIFINNVSDIEQGLYILAPDKLELHAIQTGLFSKEMADALLLNSFDIQKVGFVIHTCNQQWQKNEQSGPRGYREQQMLVGVALDHATLAVSSPDITAHTYLGFNGEGVKKLYQLPSSFVISSQLCVGSINSSCELTEYLN